MFIIINYGLGNLASIENMFRKIGIHAKVSADLADIENATKFILPGVGAFDHGMKNLRSMNVLPILERRVLQEKIPILGICLGYQLMTRQSEEGREKGLSWIPAEVKRFRIAEGQRLRVPHMGWNVAKPQKKSALLDDLDGEIRFYFVHSYFVQCDQSSDELFQTEYGQPFASGFEHENIFGVQFHPEKSHTFGMRLLRNFSRL